MEKTYNPGDSEIRIYNKWQSSNLFSPEGLEAIREKYGLHANGQTYSILMPPPNANAALHCGHATYSLQDLMIRFKRMQGYDVLYLPGTDHAGFETQVVYERKLKSEGKSRFDFDRETFFNDVLNFVKDNSTLAIDQLKKLGMSADWSRNTFTLDPYVVDFVYDTFIKMYKDGMVYRDGYMVNYSTHYGTTFSDLEVDYKDTISPLYYVKYLIKEIPDKYITVATVRPETIYADVAVAVNPADKRYKHLVGKTAINPLNGRNIPIIEDEYVEVEFGTGALKITPGHDPNDYKIGKKYNLDLISLINLDGKMNEHAIECAGLYPSQARKKAAEILSEMGALEKVDEKYRNRVLVDYKDGFPIEPMILPNWFINIDELADKAMEAINSDRVRFNLPEWKRDISRWIVEKKPWPVSRQTVFGIRIPVWYSVELNPTLQITFINSKKENITGSIKNLLAEYPLSEIKEGLQKVFATENSIFEVSKLAPDENFLPETDTFDTWFSSGQWPFVTLIEKNLKSASAEGSDSLNEKLKASSDLKKYFPTDLLDSGYDIMFFWIARMIMFSLYLTDEVPFKMVYFHGMVTDKKGQKMSKSKGNVVNPLEMAEKYGADSLRMGIIVGGNTEARVSPFDEEKVRGYRNFANKIWNMGRYLNMKIDESKNVPVYSPGISTNSDDLEIISKFNSLVSYVTDRIEKLQFKHSGEAVYHFIWDDLANNYLEKIKDRNDSEALSVFRYVFSGCLKLLHPFMPFVTEAVWEEVSETPEVPLIVSGWPESE